MVSRPLPALRRAGNPWVVVVAGRESERDTVAAALADAGFPIRGAAAAPAGVRDGWLDEAAAAVLDVAQPIGALLERWRKRGNRPVLFIAGEGDLDRLLEWRRPDDDYVLRPASGREVAVRLRAALSVRRGLGGGLEIDRDHRRVEVDGRRVDLTRLEFAVLAHLADHPGRPFSRDDLLRAVWGSRSDWQQPSTVTEHVRRVRTKLDPDEPDRWIRTVRGVGYAFIDGAD